MLLPLGAFEKATSLMTCRAKKNANLFYRAGGMTPTFLTETSRAWLSKVADNPSAINQSRGSHDGEYFTFLAATFVGLAGPG